MKLYIIKKGYFYMFALGIMPLRLEYFTEPPRRINDLPEPVSPTLNLLQIESDYHKLKW
jgi:hypothetical protein